MVQELPEYSIGKECLTHSATITSIICDVRSKHTSIAARRQRSSLRRGKAPSAQQGDERIPGRTGLKTNKTASLRQLKSPQPVLERQNDASKKIAVSFALEGESSESKYRGLGNLLLDSSSKTTRTDTMEESTKCSSNNNKNNETDIGDPTSEHSLATQKRRWRLEQMKSDYQESTQSFFSGELGVDTTINDCRQSRKQEKNDTNLGFLDSGRKPVDFNQSLSCLFGESCDLANGSYKNRSRSNRGTLSRMFSRNSLKEKGDKNWDSCSRLEDSSIFSISCDIIKESNRSKEKDYDLPKPTASATGGAASLKAVRLHQNRDAPRSRSNSERCQTSVIDELLEEGEETLPAPSRNTRSSGDVPPLLLVPPRPRTSDPARSGRGCTSRRPSRRRSSDEVSRNPRPPIRRSRSGDASNLHQTQVHRNTTRTLEKNCSESTAFPDPSCSVQESPAKLAALCDD